ncbi:hypothetical protein Patl1_18881 [Pistacia atlantica]|uniref:Uncharacterized protein n=1 Tax=Pistacia atlantica TaxID=434234 RepID=A0ACC1BYE1_9ROSI|nr:hypothetical protein Patl1_18881 [Pistacia atlantica]
MNWLKKFTKWSETQKNIIIKVLAFHFGVVLAKIPLSKRPLFFTLTLIYHSPLGSLIHFGLFSFCHIVYEIKQFVFEIKQFVIKSITHFDLIHWVNSFCHIVYA